MKRISENRLTLEDQGEPLLAIRTGIAPRGYVAQQVSALARRGAAFIRDGRTISWPIRRVVPVDGEYYLAGPLVEGETLEELLSILRGTTVPPWLTAFLRAAIVSLAHPELRLGNIRTSLVTTENGILFLNAELAREINRSVPAHHRTVVYEPYSDARLTGTSETVYQVAALAYHALTGVAPERQNEERSVVITPIHCRRPAVHSGIAAAIDGILKHDHENEATLEEIDRRLRDNPSGWTDELSPEEETRRRENANTAYAREAKTRERNTFWRKNRVRIALVAAIVVVAGMVPFSIVRNHLKPPLTAELSPLEVVDGYYRAWTELDHLFMDDAVASGIARDTIREVTNIYVIDRVQTAHEMHSRFIAPDAWLAEGKPEEKMPYGVSELETTVLHRTEERVTIIAEYVFWRPETREDDAIEVRRTRVRDRLELEPTRHGWEITGIRTRVIER